MGEIRSLQHISNLHECNLASELKMFGKSRSSWLWAWLPSLTRPMDQDASINKKTALTSPRRSRNGATLCWLRFAPKRAAIATENVLIRGSGATTEKSTEGANQPLAT